MEIIKVQMQMERLSLKEKILRLLETIEETKGTLPITGHYLKLEDALREKRAMERLLTETEILLKDMETI